MLPAVMPKNRFGLPSCMKSRVECQSGWAMMPTRNPCASSRRAADHRHAETRMVDIGVARDQDDVARIPPERVHFRLRHRQERRGTEAVRPVLAIGEEFAGGGLHGTCSLDGLDPPDRQAGQSGRFACKFKAIRRAERLRIASVLDRGFNFRHHYGAKKIPLCACST